MAGRNMLVLEHVEDIAGSVLEEYAEVVLTMIRDRYGI